MTKDAWQRFCVVGVGGHSRTKLIPALLDNGQQIVGLVSSQPRDWLPCGPVFPDLKAALRALPGDTAFILATPPELHLEQALAVIDESRDLVVEKPAFVTAGQARAIAARCDGSETVVAEAFMYRHTKLFGRFTSFWNSNRPGIEALDASFLIPETPPGTFRQSGAIAASSLYDMGCYFVALLADLKLPLDGLALSHVAVSQGGGEIIELGGILDGVPIHATIGVGAAYENAVNIRSRDGATMSFEPFFYGRSGERRIFSNARGRSREAIIDEGNAFQAMLAKPRAEWLADQTARLAQMIDVTDCLERLGRTLASFRRDGSKATPETDTSSF